jgi:hypothetical protein
MRMPKSRRFDVLDKVDITVISPESSNYLSKNNKNNSFTEEGRNMG